MIKFTEHLAVAQEIGINIGTFKPSTYIIMCGFTSYVAKGPVHRGTLRIFQLAYHWNVCIYVGLDHRY